MNDIQIKIQSMVIELIQAAECDEFRPNLGKDILDCLPGIRDGSFFGLPFETQRGKLGWINGAFFGKGERAFALFKKGLLRNDFDTEFNHVIKCYLPPSG
jgi:hypothetical protein